MRYHQWKNLFAVEQDIACDTHLQETLRLVRAEAAGRDFAARPRLSFAGLAARQFRFLAWKIWLFQGMVLAAFCAVFLMAYPFVPDRRPGFSLPKFLCLCSAAAAASALPILQRSMRYRMFELEQATRFSISGNLLSQLMFIGIGDLGMLAALALLIARYGLTTPVTVLALIMPFLTAAAACLMLLTRTDPALFQIRGVVLCLLSFLLCYGLIDRSSALTPAAGYCLFTGYCLLCLTILYRECRRLWLYRPTEKMLP